MNKATVFAGNTTASYPLLDLTSRSGVPNYYSDNVYSKKAMIDLVKNLTVQVDMPFLAFDLEESNLPTINDNSADKLK